MRRALAIISGATTGALALTGCAGTDTGTNSLQGLDFTPLNEAVTLCGEGFAVARQVADTEPVDEAVTALQTAYEECHAYAEAVPDFGDAELDRMIDDWTGTVNDVAEWAAVMDPLDAQDDAELTARLAADAQAMDAIDAYIVNGS